MIGKKAGEKIRVTIGLLRNNKSASARPHTRVVIRIVFAIKWGWPSSSPATRGRRTSDNTSGIIIIYPINFVPTEKNPISIGTTKNAKMMKNFTKFVYHSFLWESTK